MNLDMHIASSPTRAENSESSQKVRSEWSDTAYLPWVTSRTVAWGNVKDIILMLVQHFSVSLK